MGSNQDFIVDGLYSVYPASDTLPDLNDEYNPLNDDIQAESDEMVRWQEGFHSKFSKNDSRYIYVHCKLAADEECKWFIKT